MKDYIDSEFGQIKINRVANSRGISVRLDVNGNLTLRTGKLTPKMVISRMITNSRDDIKKIIDKSPKPPVYRDGDRVGYSQHVRIRNGSGFSSKETSSELLIIHPQTHSVNDHEVQTYIRQQVKKILRKQAKIYLQERLAVLADRHGFTYKKVRFTHASSRWGSCSSSGTISLNIALMKLPLQQIDYVLIHELCHTREMNHSKSFWALVAKSMPSYKLHRANLRNQSPIL